MKPPTSARLDEGREQRVLERCLARRLPVAHAGVEEAAFGPPHGALDGDRVLGEVGHVGNASSLTGL